MSEGWIKFLKISLIDTVGNAFHCRAKNDQNSKCILLFFLEEGGLILAPNSFYEDTHTVIPSTGYSVWCIRQVKWVTRVRHNNMYYTTWRDFTVRLLIRARGTPTLSLCLIALLSDILVRGPSSLWIMTLNRSNVHPWDLLLSLLH